MNQFFNNIASLSLPVLTGLERGAAWIHELPYRFARWLPTVPPKLLGRCRAAWERLPHDRIRHWLQETGLRLETVAEAIHELPYRFVRQLPGSLQEARQLYAAVREKVRCWAIRGDVNRRLAVLLPLCFAALILPVCLQPIEQTDVIYLLTEGGDPEVIRGTPQSEQQLAGLSIHTDNSARDAQLVLEAGQIVRVQEGTKLRYVTTRNETVGNLLRRLDIDYGGEKMVVLDISGQSPSICVEEEYTCDWYDTTQTDYTTVRIPNYLKEYNEESVVQAGKQGTIFTTYRDVYRMGELTDTLLVSQKITDPVDEVVEYGTLVDEVSRSDRIQEVVYNEDGSGYLLFKSGQTMTFSEKVTCSATAYSIGNWTASGLPTKVGHIAVDPKVFPYHTRFYIYTNDGYLVYGNAVAADCGTSIKGYKIDLWFETYDEACDFGRRDCTVFVLD